MEPIVVELDSKQVVEDLRAALAEIHCKGGKITLTNDPTTPKIITIKGILARKRAVNRLRTQFKILKTAAA